TRWPDRDRTKPARSVSFRGAWGFPSIAVTRCPGGVEPGRKEAPRAQSRGSRRPHPGPLCPALDRRPWLGSRPPLHRAGPGIPDSRPQTRFTHPREGTRMKTTGKSWLTRYAAMAAVAILLGIAVGPALAD